MPANPNRQLGISAEHPPAGQRSQRLGPWIVWGLGGCLSFSGGQERCSRPCQQPHAAAMVTQLIYRAESHATLRAHKIIY